MAAHPIGFSVICCHGFVQSALEGQQANRAMNGIVAMFGSNFAEQCRYFDDQFPVARGAKFDGHGLSMGGTVFGGRVAGWGRFVRDERRIERENGR